MIRTTPFQLKNRRDWPIRGDFRVVDGATPRGLAVVAHGFKGFKDWGHFPLVGERLAEAGFLAVSFNFSGSGIGGNPVEFTEADLFRDNTLSLEVDDLHKVIDFALTRAPSGGFRSVSVIGHSRGAIATWNAALTRPEVTRAVCWAGVGRLEDRYPAPVRAEWRNRGSLRVVNSRTGQVLEIGLDALDDLENHLDTLDPVRVAGGLTRPMLLVHGTADASVPFSESEAVAAATPNAQLHPIEGADHTFGAVQPFRGTTAHLEEALAVTLEFLGR